jgi:hypothetical protein
MKIFPNRQIKFVFGLMLLMGLVGCSSGPDFYVRSMIRAIDSGRTDQAISYICEDTAFLPNLPAYLIKNEKYTVLSNDGAVAIVRADLDLEIDMGIGVYKHKLPLDFVAKKGENGWCVSQESFLHLISSLIEE